MYKSVLAINYSTENCVKNEASVERVFFTYFKVL